MVGWCASYQITDCQYLRRKKPRDSRVRYTLEVIDLMAARQQLIDWPLGSVNEMSGIKYINMYIDNTECVQCVDCRIH